MSIYSNISMIMYLNFRRAQDSTLWAMCSEGGEGADIKYISPKDNRGAGSWVGHKLDEYADGTKVEFIVK